MADVQSWLILLIWTWERKPSVLEHYCFSNQPCGSLGREHGKSCRVHCDTGPGEASSQFQGACQLHLQSECRYVARGEWATWKGAIDPCLWHGHGTAIIASGQGTTLEISEILEKAWHVDSLKCLKFANSAAKHVMVFSYSSLPIICASGFCSDITLEVSPRQFIVGNWYTDK